MSDDVMCECLYCGDTYEELNGYDDEFCCADCYYSYNDDGDGIPERKWSKVSSSDFMSNDDGLIIKSRRTFSVELESYYPRSSAAHRVADNIPRAVGISPDGSLGNRGIEFQSPKLRGSKGEKLVRDLCRELNNEDFRVNRSCGFHTHLDGKDLLPKTRTKHEARAIKNVMMIYLAYEDVLQSFLPRSRRNNRYAIHLRESFHINEVQECYTLEQCEKLWYRVAKRRDLKYRKGEHYNSTRYHGLNLHSLYSDGHLEIRYHSGTINAEKILHWVQLHSAMVDHARDNRIDAQKVRELVDIKEKTESLFELIKLPEATREYYRHRQNVFSGITREDNENGD